MTLSDGFATVEALITEGLTTTAPAVSLAVYRRRERLVNQAWGVLDPETRSQPATVDTLFDLASLTKLYTTTAFLMQAGDGKVRLDTRVVEVLPDFGGEPRPIGAMQDPHTLELIAPDAETAALPPVDPTKITFRQLLTHTAGLPPWRDLYQHTGPIPPPPGTPDPVPPAERLQTAQALIAATPFADQPGRTVRYSDLGLILLGAAVQRLDLADSLERVLVRRVLRPAGLDSTTTRYLPPDAARCAPTEFDARWRNRRIRGEVHDENAAGLGGIAGHAGLFGTADEVAQFGVFWLDSLRGSGELPRELAQDAVALHAATGLERRGLGWMLRTPGHSSSGQYFSDESFGHTGFTGTSLWVDPVRQVVVALLTNRVYHGRDASAILEFRKAVHDAVAQWLVFK